MGARSESLYISCFFQLFGWHVIGDVVDAVNQEGGGFPEGLSVADGLHVCWPAVVETDAGRLNWVVLPAYGPLGGVL